MNLSQKFIMSSLFLLSFVLISTHAFAVGSGGHENASYSAKQLARAGAVTADPTEPAAISYNPAGIVDLPGIQVQSTVSGINIWTHYSGNLGNSKSSATTAIVPTGYITINPGDVFDHRVAFGIGSDSPFGLANKYDSTHPAYHSTGYRNALKMYTIKPTVAVRLTDWLSIGGGPTYNRIFKLRTVNSYANSLVVAALPDGEYDLNMSGHGWGWQLGALAKINPQHQVGFYFRSAVHAKLKGQMEVERALNPVTFTANNSLYFGANSKTTLPLNFTLAYAYKPSERTTLEADFGFTRWSSVNRLATAHDGSGVDGFNNAIINGIMEGVDNEADWKNGFSIQVGGEHKLTEKLTLRGGGFFYSHVIPENHFSNRIPDGDTVAASLGVGYTLSDYINIDMSYLARFVINRNIDNTVTNGVGGSIDGRYGSYGHVWTASVTYKWDNPFGLFNKGGNEIEMPSVVSA